MTRTDRGPPGPNRQSLPIDRPARLCGGFYPTPSERSLDGSPWIQVSQSRWREIPSSLPDGRGTEWSGTAPPRRAVAASTSTPSTYRSAVSFPSPVREPCARCRASGYDRTSHERRYRTRKLREMGARGGIVIGHPYIPLFTRLTGGTRCSFSGRRWVSAVSGLIAVVAVDSSFSTFARRRSMIASWPAMKV